MFRKINKRAEELLENRLLVLVVMFIVLFGVLVYRLFVVQIINGNSYKEKFVYRIQKTVKTSGTRGNIYDTNGKLLAYDELVYSVNFQNDTQFKTLAQTNNTSENYEKNQVIYQVIKILEANGDDVLSDLPIELTGNGKYKFTETGTKLEKFKRDAFGIGTDTSTLTSEQKKLRKQQLNASAQQVVEYFKKGTLGSAGVGKMFDIDSKYSDEDALKIISVRYSAYQSRYSQYMKVTIANNISTKSIAAIEEQSDTLVGIDVATKSKRVYNCSEAMSHIIGYTGTVNTDELKTYNKGKEEDDDDYYSSDETVGKAGIEKELETYLHGNSGSETLVVNNIGKVIDVTDTKKAEKGNDVTLSIDSDLQEYAYNILERRIAGIVLSKLTTSESKGGSSDDIRIPIKDVYYSLIGNSVVDITSLNADDASSFEKRMYKKIQSLKSEDIERIKDNLLNSKRAYANESDEIQSYTSYVYELLTNKKVLISSSINIKDKTYLKWRNEKIGLGEFLRYAINQEWIDISKLDVSSKYSETEDIMEALVDYLRMELADDDDFDLIVCQQKIDTGELSGRSVCLLLYEQGILSKKKDSDYSSLRSGSMSAYSFMKKKISDLDITPGQLGLDPCSGSVVITDPDTGKLKALVSYPGYDSNKLSNGTDNQYYLQLSNSTSTPLYNQALNHKMAPGSTFKPLSSIAALNEGVLSTSSTIKTEGIFTKVTPAARCWYYTNTHGNHGTLTVDGAIEVSCNYFFYEVGYLLGSQNGSFSDKEGLSILKKYATMLGLNKKSGVELSEASPEASDESAVRSAIGQGTNNYTPSQISNYVTTLASKGSVYDLSVLEKITDKDGKTIKKYGVKKVRDVKLKDKSYWNSVWSGMYKVANGKKSSVSSIFKELDKKIAGKTGTAQENKNRPNHALFMSFGPYDDPEISVTAVIPFGYSSSNAAATARDIYAYYFANKKERQKLAKQKNVLSLGSSSSAGD